MKKNRDHLKLILFLMTLGSSMYGLFTPIYYLDQGVSYNRVILSLALFCVGGILSGVLANIMIHRLGVKIFIVSRGMIEPLLILLLNSYPVLKFPPELQLLFSGFIALSFWVSMDVLTVKITDKEHRGKQQSNIYSGMWISSVVAPFIGGFLISQFGYTSMFIVALVLVLSGGLLSLSLNLHAETTRKISFLPNLKGAFGPHMILIFLRGLTFSIVAWLFPLIIYEKTNSMVILGSIGTILSITALISNHISGHIIDKYKHFVNWVFLLGAAAWLVALIPTIILYAIILISLLYYMINIILNTLFFNAVEKEDVVSLVSERMMAFSLGGMLTMLLRLIVPYYALFLISSGAVLFSVLVLKRATIVS